MEPIVCQHCDGCSKHAIRFRHAPLCDDPDRPIDPCAEIEENHVLFAFYRAPVPRPVPWLAMRVLTGNVASIVVNELWSI